jgi:hypothetical protein
MKQTKTTILLALRERHSPETILPTTKLITNWNGKYWRGLETEDFIFFVNYQEGDENSCVMMYRKSDFSLASNNYFGYEAMFEIITEKPNEITYLSPAMKNNIKLYKEAHPDYFVEA